MLDDRIETYPAGLLRLPNHRNLAGQSGYMKGFSNNTNSIAEMTMQPVSSTNPWMTIKAGYASPDQR